MDRLTEMEAFATVVDQGGFTDAAKKMGISKSAVSKHVSALEARLDARLLNLTTRRVSPTEIGLAYYDRARRVLNDAGEADALVTSMQSARPEKIDDLNEHKLLYYSNQANGAVWKITAPSGEKRQVRTAGWLTVNDDQSLLNACISGLGIAYLPSFLYADAMAKGLVQEAIPDLPVETQGIYAVYPPGRFTQPKVRAFIDFLVHSFADKGPENW